MASKFPLKLLKRLEELEASLVVDTDLLRLSLNLVGCRVLSKEVSDRFSSLDHHHLEQQVKVRYLLKHVYEKVREDSRAYGRLIKVLSRLGGETEKVCRAMNREVSVQNSNSREAKHGGEVFITAKDIPLVVELIVAGSHRWEEIGIALGVPEYVREECKSARSYPLKLSKLLSAWISGQYEHCKSTTLNSLKTALAGEIVKLPDVAQKLNSFSSLSEITPILSTSQYLEGLPLIEYQSYDTEVTEGKSTLLEVKVVESGLESYQWSKDGQPLLDGADFSGVCTNILYINRASQSTEGKYACCVSRGSETEMSDEISLRVIYPPEKSELLKLYSITEKNIPQDSWPPVSNSSFVNLVLIEQKPINTCIYYTIRGGIDDILESKKVAEYEEVFREYREGALVVIEGRPGSGKTTLVHKLTRDWASGNKVLQGARMVFLVTLRLLNVSRRRHTLLDLLQIFYEEILSKSVEHNLQVGKGKGACFILDGLDEYPITSENSSVIEKLLYTKTFLPLSMVVVASRPIATGDLQTICQTRIEVIGFSKDQIYSYVRSYPFQDCSIACKMEKFLEQHPNVFHMCYVPVCAAMICFLFSKLEGKILQTETQVYEQFTIATYLRHRAHNNKGIEVQIKSLTDICEEDKKMLLSVCELAFDMTINSQQVVNKSSCRTKLLTDLGFGLLTIAHTYAYYGGENTYTFHHLTFQEFLAAFYIREAQIESKKLIGQNNLNNVWKFYCGLIQSSQHLRFAKLICDRENLHLTPDHHTMYKFQCAFESQQVELCDHVIRNSHIDLRSKMISSTDFIAIGYVVSKSTKPVTSITLQAHKWDREGIRVFTSMATSVKLQSIKSLKVSIVDEEMSLSLKALLSNLIFLNELDINKTKLSKSTIEVISNRTKLPHLETLKLTLPLVPPCSHPEEVFKLLTFCSDNIKEVFYSIHEVHPINHVMWRKILSHVFGCQVIQDSAMSWLHLYNSVTVPSLSIERLSCCSEVVLVNCCIGDEGAEILANSLNTSVLESLILDFNSITDAGTVALAGCLARCSVVQEVSLQCNSIGDSGATALAEVLVHCSSLRKLDLQGNSLEDTGAVEIVKAVKNLPGLDVYLYNANITRKGIERILEHRVRTKIRSMVFTSSWSSVSEADMDTLRRALHCENLPALKISRANISNIERLVAKQEYVKSIRGIEWEYRITEDTVPTLCSIITALPNLHHIECFFDVLGSASRQIFSDSLKTCKLTHSLVLKDIGIYLSLLDAVKSFPKLYSLDLSRCAISSSNISMLSDNPEILMNLLILKLEHNGIGSDGAQVLGRMLVHCKNLHYLTLSRNDIGDNGAVAIAEGLMNHTELLGLELGYNGAISQGMAALSHIIRSNYQLQHLGLAKWGMSSNEVSVLVDLPCKGSLRTLNLYNNYGNKLNLRLMNFENLVELDIGLSNVDIASLSQLQYCSSLQVVKLSQIGITSNDMSILLDVMKTCKYLRFMDLTGNFIGVNGASFLLVGWQHKSLLTLDLYKCLGNPHDSALENGDKCCHDCDHLLQLYHNSEYVYINDVPKLMSLRNNKFHPHFV